MEHYDHKSHLLSGGRYPVLRTIAILYMIGAILVCIYGLFVAAWCLFGQPAVYIPISFTPAWGSRILGCITALGGTFLAVISMLAIAEGIKLFIDAANSLRITARNSMSGGAMASAGAPSVAVVTDSPTVVTASSTPSASSEGIAPSSDGRLGGRLGGLEEIDAETAEGALIRGH